MKIKRYNRRYLFSLLILLFISCKNEVNKGINDDVLWYEQPAKAWEEALPLGNGRLGAMVFGKTSNEYIQLNDDSMWSGGNENWGQPEGTPEDLQNIRDLLFKGKNKEADKMFVDKFSNKTIIRSHQTMGDLYFDFAHDNISDYKRTLNISNATSTISYKSNGSQITEEVFVSNPHKVIVIKFTSDAKDGLNGKIRLNRPKDEGHPTVSVKTEGNKLLVMEGEVTQHGGKFKSEPYPIIHGVKFETCLKVNNEGGTVINGDDYLELKNVKQAVFYIVANSSYYFDDYKTQNKKDLQLIEASSYETILKAHLKDYKGLYDRVELKLTESPKDSIPTDKRLDLIKEGALDLGLEALLFQYGRYLLIGSSRQGTNPANLQGLWNKHIVAPWNADYHLNINLQMNYWLANKTNLAELNYPLFDYVDKLIESGKETAQKNFGCNGAILPHATDLWAPTWLRAPTAYWGCSLGAGGWMVQHYWNHYEFTKDTTFLKERAFPAIHEIAHFYSDWLIEDPRDGYLISAPSTSPENRFFNKEGEQVATCLGSAMDQQVISEVFTNYIKACEDLNINTTLLEKIKKQKQQLRPGFVIGSDGRILEWDREYKEPEPGHRHMSHLYGFHPGNEITKNSTPEIFKSVKKTLDYRLDHGGAGTGWSRAWLINCSARLLDGDMAHEHVDLLLKKSIIGNLFDLCPPFQIDGNFGFTAGVAEMLLQSHEASILRVLPALPSVWKTGYVKGLTAINGLTVDLFWSEGNLDKAIIHSNFDTNFSVIYSDVSYPVKIAKGETYIFEPK